MKSNQARRDEILQEFAALEEEETTAPEAAPPDPPRKKSLARRLLRFFLWTFGLLVLLIVAAGIALSYFFPSEKIRPIAEEELAKILHMPVSIGSVDLSLLRGLDVKQVKLGGDKPLFTLDALILDYDLTQLLQGRFIINQVMVDKPDIYLESVDRVWNFQPILEGKDASPEPEKKSEDDKESETGDAVVPPFGVDLKQFLIRDTRLTVNMDGHTHARLEGLNVEAQGKVNESEVDVGVRVHLTGVPGGGANLAVTSTQEPGLDVKTLATTDLKFSARDLNRVHLNGTLGLENSSVRVGEALPAPDLAADIELSVDHKAQTLSLPLLNLTIDERNQVRLSAQADKILTGPDFSAKLERFLLHLEDAIAWAGDTIPPVTARGTLKVSNVEAMGRLPEFKPESLKLEGGTIELADVSATHAPSKAKVAGLNATILIGKALVDQGVPQSASADVSIKVKKAGVPDYSVEDLKHTLKLEAKGANLPEARFEVSLSADAVTASLPDLGTVKTPIELKGSGAGHLEKGDLDALSLDYSAGTAVSGSVAGTARDFGKRSFAVDKKLDVDLKAALALLPKALAKQIKGTVYSGDVSVAANVKGKLDDSFQPVAAQGHSDIQLKGVDAVWNEPKALTKGLWANVALPIQFDNKRGVKISDLKIESRFAEIQALDNWTVGPAEIETGLSMRGHYDLKKPEARLPVTNTSHVFLAQVQSKQPELSVTKLIVDSEFAGDLHGKEVKNASVNGTVLIGDVAGLKEVKAGRIGTTFSARVNDLSLTKTQADVKLTVEAPKSPPKEGQFALGPLTFESTSSQNLKKGDIDIKKLILKAPELVDLSVQGKLNDWGKRFDVRTQVPLMNLTALFDRVPQELLAGLEGMEGLDVQGTATLDLDARGALPKSFELKQEALPVTAKAVFTLDGGGVVLPGRGLRVEGLNVATDIDFLKGDGAVSGGLSAEKLYYKDALGESFLNPRFDFKYALSDFNKFTIDAHTFAVPNHGIRHTFSGRVDGLKPFLTGKEPLRVDAIAKRLDISLSTKNTLQTEKALASDSAAALLENFQADGTLHSLLTLKLTADKKFEVDGNFEFEKFNTKIPAGVAVKNVTGKFPFNKTLLLDRRRVRPESESFSASKKGFFSQLRDFSRYKNNLMIDAIDIQGQTLSNIGLDLLFKNNQLRAEKFLFDVLEGSVAGNLFVAQTQEGPALNFSTEFAGLNFGSLVGRSRAEEAAFSEIDGNLQFDLKVQQGSGPLTLDQIFTKVAITRIGAETFDRALLFLDPEESKPAIVDTRAKLKLASPHKLLVTLENGNLNAEAWLKNKVLGDIIKAPELKRIPISSLKQFRSINDQLQVLSGLKDVLNLLAARGVEFDEEGKPVFF